MNGGVSDAAGERDLRTLFENWVDSDRKARIVLFFHENPGVIETVEGLARRLGVNPRALARDVQDHVRLGVLRERRVGDKTVFVYDRMRRGAIEKIIERLIGEQERRVLGDGA